MSELTQCNFCSLKDIRRRAEEEGNRVFLRIGWHGGTDVYVLPPGVEMPEKIEHGDENHEGDAFHQKYSVAWFMALPSECAC